jgi:general secretion pathway protein L
VAAGEPSPDDFLALADGLRVRSAPCRSTASRRSTITTGVDVTFKPGVNIDADLNKRLARNGLSGTQDSSSGKWTIRSAS